MSSEYINMISGKFTFGKYKGKTFSILEHDPQYAEWLANKMDKQYMTNELEAYLLKTGHLLEKRPTPKIPGIEDDERVITWGKYKSNRFDTLPTPYLYYIHKTTENSKNGGNKVYKCEDKEVLEYARERCMKEGLL